MLPTSATATAVEIRRTARCGPCGAGPQAPRDRRGYASAAGTHGSLNADDCSAGTSACSPENSTSRLVGGYCRGPSPQDTAPTRGDPIDTSHHRTPTRLRRHATTAAVKQDQRYGEAPGGSNGAPRPGRRQPAGESPTSQANRLWSSLAGPRGATTRRTRQLRRPVRLVTVTSSTNHRPGGSDFAPGTATLGNQRHTLVHSMWTRVWTEGMTGREVAR